MPPEPAARGLTRARAHREYTLCWPLAAVPPPPPLVVVVSEHEMPLVLLPAAADKPQAQKERPPARPVAHDAGWPPHALKAATRAAQSLGLSPEEPTVPFKKQHVTGLWGRGGGGLKRVGCRSRAAGEARCEGVGAGEGGLGSLEVAAGDEQQGQRQR